MRCREWRADANPAGRMAIVAPASGGARTEGCGKPMLVRLRDEDRLLLDARAEARGMRSATYVSVLIRSHLRQLAPLPKDELLALKRSIARARLDRPEHQPDREGGERRRPDAGLGGREFRAMLKICEALRDNTKALLKANETSWETGHVQADL